MANKIVLISDDSDFFDYIKSKLELRKSDELFTFSFDSVPEKLELIKNALLIVNCENEKDKTLDLLNIFKGTPVIGFVYNDDDTFRRKCFRAGMLDFMTILIPDSEFRARIVPALAVSSLLEKNNFYKEILIKKEMLSDNEVFKDYETILDKELELISMNKKKAVIIAIAPNEKSKFTLKAELIEAIILNNLRKNDILMSYAPQKYFILIYDIDLEKAKKLWNKIQSQFSQKIYAGIVNITNQKRQQLINEVLNRLHQDINSERDSFNASQNFSNQAAIMNSQMNFKQFKQNFVKKMNQIINPVFYQAQQKYQNKFMNVKLEHQIEDGGGSFVVYGNNTCAVIKITSPGFAKINIDIFYEVGSNIIDSKRITLEPEEFESGVLEDLMEQFLLEFKKGQNNVS